MAYKFHTIEKYNYDFDGRIGGPRFLQLWSSTALIADIHFVADNAPLPAAQIAPGLMSAVAYMRWSACMPLIDMLRNEKPIRVQLNDSPPGYVLIGTGLEPIGENE